MEHLKRVMPRIGWPLAVVGLTLAVWSGTLKAPFLFDDVPGVKNDEEIRKIENCGMFLRHFLARSMVRIGYALNYQVASHDDRGTPSARAFHAGNWFLHALNALLVYWLANLCLGQIGAGGSAANRRRLSAAVALVFALHPINGMSVNLIASRAGMQEATFSLLSLIAVTAARGASSRWGKWGLCSLATVCIAGAIGSKVSGICSVPLIAAILCVLSEPRAHAARRRLVFLLMGACGGGAVVLLLWLAQGIFQTWGAPDGWSYFLTQGKVLVLYAVLHMWPAWLSMEHDVSMVFWMTDGAAMASWFAVGFVVSLGLVLLVRRNLLGLGIVWFFIVLAPSSSVIARSEVILEYRVYLATVGFAIVTVALVCWGAAQIGEMTNGRGRRVATIMLIGIACLESLNTVHRNRLFADPVLLWIDASDKAPGRSRPYVNLSVLATDAGRIEEAGQLMHLAMRTMAEGDRESNANVYNAWGLDRARENGWGAAMPYFRTALDLYPNSLAALNNLAIACAETGDLAEAGALWVRILAITPDDADALSNVGMLKMRNDDVAGAIELYRRALSMPGDHWQAHHNLGIALERQGEAGEAAGHFWKALEISPGNPGVSISLARTLSDQQSFTDAQRVLFRSIEMNADVEELKEELDCVLRNMVGKS